MMVRDQKQRARKMITITIFMVIVFLTSAQARDTSGYIDRYNAGFLASEAGDYHTAALQWQPLAERGDAAAQFNLALMYHRGLGVTLDENIAVSLYKQSAANGYAKAQEFLAVAYREGWFGLPRDHKKADYWDDALTNE